MTKSSFDRYKRFLNNERKKKNPMLYCHKEKGKLKLDEEGLSPYFVTTAFVTEKVV